jgi:hypothetical protein
VIPEQVGAIHHLLNVNLQDLLEVGVVPGVVLVTVPPAELALQDLIVVKAPPNHGIWILLASVQDPLMTELEFGVANQASLPTPNQVITATGKTCPA